MVHRPFLFAVLLTAICLLLAFALPVHAQVVAPHIQSVQVVCGFRPEALIQDALRRGQTQVHTMSLATAASGTIVVQALENPDSKAVTVIVFAGPDDACTLGMGSFAVDRPKGNKKQL